MSHKYKPLVLSLLAAFAVAATGCANQDVKLDRMVFQGELGEARVHLAPRVKPAEKSGNLDRNFVLERMNMGIATLADGYAIPESTWNDVYDVLRRSGVNKDNEVAAVLLNEGVKVWKGEPFEQAMGFHYIGIHYAMQGGWDNARAAYSNSLFQLASVMTGPNGKPLSSEEVVERAKKKQELSDTKLEDTDFTLGYLMGGIVNKQLQISTGSPDRGREADEKFASAAKLSPQLKAEIETLRNTGNYNVIYVVEYGQGPQKTATGMDHIIAGFKPLLRSDGNPLEVSQEGHAKQSFPIVCDLNTMAQDHRWNDLQDMRTAKSIIGDVLLVGGAGATAYGAYDHSDAALYAGIGSMLAGAAVKASSHADTRYCEVLPQRIYVVPLMITQPNTKVVLQVAGVPWSTAVAVLNPPKGRTAEMCYMRLLSPVSESSPENKVTNPAIVYTQPSWYRTGEIHYSSDEAPDAGGPPFPYILGGHDVRTPTQEALNAYNSAGFLRGMTLDQLQHLYVAEGIAIEPQDIKNGIIPKHILEGGRSLLCPKRGSVGFSRLFGVERAAYQPKSQELIQARAQLRRLRRDEVK